MVDFTWRGSVVTGSFSDALRRAGDFDSDVAQAVLLQLLGSCMVTHRAPWIRVWSSSPPARELWRQRLSDAGLSVQVPRWRIRGDLSAQGALTPHVCEAVAGLPVGGIEVTDGAGREILGASNDLEIFHATHLSATPLNGGVEVEIGASTVYARPASPPTGSNDSS